MALDLDDRQRAMLQEMGVRVWLPGTAFATEPALQGSVQPAASPVPAPAAQSPRALAPQPPAAAEVLRAPSLPVSPAATPRAAPRVTAARPGDAVAADVDALDWNALADTAAQCQACGLCAGRKNTTLCPQSPAVQADWMVVGDPPDEDEDRFGQPFMEQSGLLLDNMLKAVGASRNGAGRQGAYLTNVVKCRPPHSHVPQAAELAQCAAYLQREIALVQPRIILAMGRFANQLLLSEHPMLASQPLGKLRGTVYHYQGVPVVVTYHPKVLLRATADKAKAWADLCLAMQTL